MDQISDITEGELWVVETTLKERYGGDVDAQLADSEVRLNVSDRELTACPVLYWSADGCNFVVFKTGDRRYRAQFFYRGFQQYGTGVREYDDLTECVVSLLQAQADHEAQARGDLLQKRR
ncbi:MAG: hypothetical protein PVF91_12025 [Chromatiales bacterium]|jgi:hypothetical protein